jgi:hypothetical protein
MSKNIYQENGYKNRKEYLESLAEDYGLDYGTVALLAGTMGASEDFDGLVSMLEDYEDYGF